VQERREWGLREWINGDISAGDLSTLATVGGKPEVVMHLAGGSSVGFSIAQPREDFARTVAGTAALLDWLRLSAPGARLAVASSAAVYGARHSGQIREAAAAKPSSPYGYHKLLMEQMCESYGATYGLQTISLRFFSVYGPELKKQLLWDLCEMLRAGVSELRLGGSGAELRDWVHIQDAARAMVMFSRNASEEAPALNIGSGVATTVAEVVEMVRRAWIAAGGRAPPARFCGNSRLGDPFSLIADTTHLAKLGFVIERRLDEGVDEYVRWFMTRS
jgi:UDP-glucose 4-epimerase